MSAAIIYKYIGRGEFQHGIPARDLTLVDMQSLLADGIDKERIEATGLYTLVERPSKAEKGKS